MAVLTIAFDPESHPATPCADASLDALRLAIPAAAGLPLLTALAGGTAQRLTLAYLDALGLQVDLAPLDRPTPGTPP